MLKSTIIYNITTQNKKGGTVRRHRFKLRYAVMVTAFAKSFKHVNLRLDNGNHAVFARSDFFECRIFSAVFNDLMLDLGGDVNTVHQISVSVKFFSGAHQYHSFQFLFSKAFCLAEGVF
jgi:hypothetical protein